MKFPLSVGKVKKSANKRYEFGVKVKDQAPKSPIYQQTKEVQASADVLIIDTENLKIALDKFTIVEAQYKKARTELGAAVDKWDGSFDYYQANGEKFCASADDAAGLGFDPLVKARHTLAPPLSVEARQDFKKDLLRMQVKGAPGMRKVRVEVSRDGGLTWMELPGDGAKRDLSGPAPGTYLIRARSVTASAFSEYTAPISVTVK